MLAAWTVVHSPPLNPAPISPVNFPKDRSLQGRKAPAFRGPTRKRRCKW